MVAVQQSVKTKCCGCLMLLYIVEGTVSSLVGINLDNAVEESEYCICMVYREQKDMCSSA